ncbi:MAG TPA: radical SAM/SPASM domain-containing protein, partial [Spirochaeta sp.]|nr:radical SAM/SPASM domain-containing protein [Spirochaeta sp.]
MNYKLSKHNIISQIKDSDDYFIINPLSKNADILDSNTAKSLLKGDFPNQEELIEKGYLTVPENEEKLFKTEYLDFLDSRDDDELQIFYVPTYACNFNCTYCYQEGYENEKPTDYAPVIKAFFEYVDTEFAGRRKYITVFGGEPLLPDENTRKKIKLIVEEANRRNLSLAFVTNAYSLDSYIPLLKTASIREIQITLDGPADIHDKRRPLHSGTGTFREVVAGIDAALSAGLPVNLRAVMDRENMPALPELAAFAVEKGWTDNPLFKTQLGRNYELHYCQDNANRLYDRLSMYEDLYSLIKENPVVMDFHRPAYSISRFLFDNGEMPDPLFDSCPGCKTEWAFDYSGHIFSCTATVGKPGESLGTFFPEVTLKEDAVAAWQDRDVTSIPECRSCEMRLACGGG